VAVIVTLSLCCQCAVSPFCRLSWPGSLPLVQCSSTQSCCPVQASIPLCTAPAGQRPSLQLKTGKTKRLMGGNKQSHIKTKNETNPFGHVCLSVCFISLLVLGLRNMEGSCDPPKLVSQFLLRKTLVQVRRRILQCCRPGFPNNIVKVTHAHINACLLDQHVTWVSVNDCASFADLQVSAGAVVEASGLPSR